jgi:hypothetical protein
MYWVTTAALNGLHCVVVVFGRVLLVVAVVN